jgi:hypothetical protein
MTAIIPGTDTHQDLGRNEELIYVSINPLVAEDYNLSCYADH